MQVITCLGIGTLHDLVPFNLAAAVGATVWQLRRARRPGRGGRRWRNRALASHRGRGRSGDGREHRLPVEAADAYQLERIAQIERLGTLDYDPSADPKVNIVTGAFYELMLADLKQIPLGPVDAAHARGAWRSAVSPHALHGPDVVRRRARRGSAACCSSCPWSSISSC